MMNILITGGTGYVGSNLIKFLLKKNFNIYVIKRKSSDLINLKSLKNRVNFYDYSDNILDLSEYIKKNNIDIVYHLASMFTAEHSSEDINSLIDSNIKFGTVILEAMKNAGVRKLINTGTSWQHFENQAYNPVCLYSATKESFEKIIDYYVQAESFKVITLKLFDTYGNNDNRKKLISVLMELSKSRSLIKMSPGNQQINLTHIDDVCEAFYIAFNHLYSYVDPMHNKYKVDSDETYSLKKVIEIFEEINKVSLNIKWGARNYRKREVMSVWSKGRRLPNWKPKISLKKGLKLKSSN